MRYRRLTFFSNTAIPREIEPPLAEHVITLSEMFFIRDHLRIKSMTCAAMQPRDIFDRDLLLRQLIEFHTLVTFAYTIPQRDDGRPFLTEEHGSVFAFSPESVFDSLIWHDHNVIAIPPEPTASRDESGRVQGYSGKVNGLLPIWTAKGSRIYPPTPQMWLNVTQDLSIEIEARFSPHLSQLFDDHYGRDVNGDLPDRISSALRWYNRSASQGIDPDLAISSLAIALETLLDLEPGESVTSRFREAVTLLVGRVPRLDSWIHQFYDARSEVMHKGRSSNAMFQPIDDPKARKGKHSTPSYYRSLAAYARHIFHICLATILVGTGMSQRIGLSGMLMTNQQRYETICRILSDKSQSPFVLLKSISVIASEIEAYQFVNEDGLKLETVLSAAKAVARCFVESGGDPSVNESLAEFIDAKDDATFFASLECLGKVDSNMRLVQSAGIAASPIVFRTAYTILGVSWMYVSFKYANLIYERQLAAETAKELPPSEPSTG